MIMMFETNYNNNNCYYLNVLFTVSPLTKKLFFSCKYLLLLVTINETKDIIDIHVNIKQ